MRDSGRRLCIVIVAEGAQDDSGNPVTSNHIREVRRLVKTKFPCELSAIIKLQSYLHYRLPLHNDHLSTTGTCVASVSVRFRNKERGTRAKDRAKNCASKREGRGWEEWKETPACSLRSPPPPPSFIFWYSFHFSRGQNRKSRSSVFLYSETKRKRFSCLHYFFLPYLQPRSQGSLLPSLRSERYLKKNSFSQEGFCTLPRFLHHCCSRSF